MLLFFVGQSKALQRYIQCGFESLLLLTTCCTGSSHLVPKCIQINWEGCIRQGRRRWRWWWWWQRQWRPWWWWQWQWGRRGWWLEKDKGARARQKIASPQVCKKVEPTNDHRCYAQGEIGRGDEEDERGGEDAFGGVSACTHSCHCWARWSGEGGVQIRSTQVEHGGMAERFAKNVSHSRVVEACADYCIVRLRKIPAVSATASLKKSAEKWECTCSWWLRMREKKVLWCQSKCFPLVSIKWSSQCRFTGLRPKTQLENLQRGIQNGKMECGTYGRTMVIVWVKVRFILVSLK